MRTIAVIAVTFLAGFNAASASGASLFLERAKGEFSTFLRDLKYDPSRACYKPIKPYGRDDLGLYRSQARRYLDCLKDAAESDVEYANKVIAAGYEDALNDFRNSL